MRLSVALGCLAMLCMTLPDDAFAWGETGHRVVCQIAFDELSESARAEVERLLGLDPDFDNFADSCLYADIPERIREFEHFMNVPRSSQAITTDACPLAGACVLTAIQDDTAVLKDPMAGDDEKLLALILLGHWVADIHQPLHVSFKDDRGANYVLVDLDVSDANLHGVWDYTIVAYNLGHDYRQIAATLRASISEQQRMDWRYDSPVVWANESYQLTLSPSVGYCTRKEGACWHAEDNMLLDDGEQRRLMPISDDYLEQHGPVVSRRLQQAGIRLAALLERALE